jgi:hypothetical protein
MADPTVAVPGASTPPVTAPAAPVPGSPEYNAAMVAKFDQRSGNPDGAAPPPTTPVADRPAWLPEKFKTPEDMAKAYGELESKLGAPKPPVAPTAAPKDPLAVTPQAAPTEAAAAQAVASAGLDFGALEQEFLDKGAISPENYATLEAKGIGKEVVDNYIAGRQALAKQYESEVKSVAGGDEGWTKLVSWAATALSPAEIQAFNNATASRDTAMAKLAVSGLQARYTAQYGSQPPLVGGKSVSGPGGYESVAQMKADMKDPRYKVDPAFRKQVEQRVANATFYNVIERS